MRGHSDVESSAVETPSTRSGGCISSRLHFAGRQPIPAGIIPHHSVTPIFFRPQFRRRHCVECWRFFALSQFLSPASVTSQSARHRCVCVRVCVCVCVCVCPACAALSLSPRWLPVPSVRSVSFSVCVSVSVCLCVCVSLSLSGVEYSHQPRRDRQRDRQSDRQREIQKQSADDSVRLAGGIDHLWRLWRRSDMHFGGR